MSYRSLTVLLAVSLLSGCQWLPQYAGSPSIVEAEASSGCRGDIPVLVASDCLLDSWVAFGLASQRGDRVWREAMLARLEKGGAGVRLARAVVLSWGVERQWDQASELYKAELEGAPRRLKPLLRYWLNELEGRRAMAARLARSEAQRGALARDNEQQATKLDEMTEKLDALTDIEESINLRQQSP